MLSSTGITNKDYIYRQLKPYMKNKFIALLFIATCFNTHTLTAKNDSTSVIKNGIGISIMPMLSMPTYVNQSNYYNNTLKGSIGGTAALCQNIVLSKKQNFYLYTELGYQTNAYINNLPGGLFVGGNSATVKVINRNSNGYFSLSLQKVIFHISKKLGMFAGVGAQISYCYATSQIVEQAVNNNGQVTTNTQTYTSNNIPQQNQWAAAAVARVGFFVNPTKHLSLNIAPVFYYGISPQYIFTQNNPGYNSLGLNLQIMYCF